MHSLALLHYQQWPVGLCKKLMFATCAYSQVTNHMVSGERGIHKPALGESWKSIPHVRLELSREHGSNICNMCIVRHPCMVMHTVAHSWYWSRMMISIDSPVVSSLHSIIFTTPLSSAYIFLLLSQASGKAVTFMIPWLGSSELCIGTERRYGVKYSWCKAVWLSSEIAVFLKGLFTSSLYYYFFL